MKIITETFFNIYRNFVSTIGYVRNFNLNAFGLKTQAHKTEPTIGRGY